MSNLQFLACLSMILTLIIVQVNAFIDENSGFGWDVARATFYGDMSGRATMSKCYFLIKEYG